MCVLNRIVVFIALLGMVLGSSIDAVGALPGGSRPPWIETHRTEHLILAQFRGGFGMRMSAPSISIPRPPMIRPPVIRPPTPQVRIPSVFRPPIAGRPGLTRRLPVLRPIGAAGRAVAAQVRARLGLTGLAARLQRAVLIGREKSSLTNTGPTPRAGLIRSADWRGKFRNRVGEPRSGVSYGQILSTRGMRKFVRLPAEIVKPGVRRTRAPGNDRAGVRKVGFNGDHRTGRKFQVAAMGDGFIVGRFLSSKVALKGVFGRSTKAALMRERGVRSAVMDFRLKTALQKKWAANDQQRRPEQTAKGKVFYRNMSKAEYEAVKATGLLRGGRPGETYFTDQRFRSAEQAKDRLSLEQKPEVQVQFRVTSDPKLVRGGTRVKAANGGRGGGREYMTGDAVKVEVINAQPY